MNIIIVDDHHLIRAGLKEQLCQWFEAATVLQAASGSEALQQLRDVDKLDLALVDLFMPEGDGFKFIRELCKQFPNLPILVLSSSQNPGDIRKALGMGATGFATKASPAEEIHKAIKKVMAGGVYVPPRALVQDLPVEAGNTLEQVKTQLTERQLEVLILMADGLSNKQIARHYDLSYNTVKVHVSAILHTLGLDNRIHATIMAKNLGLESFSQNPV